MKMNLRRWVALAAVAALVITSVAYNYSPQLKATDADDTYTSEQAQEEAVQEVVLDGPAEGDAAEPVTEEPAASDENLSADAAVEGEAAVEEPAEEEVVEEVKMPAASFSKSVGGVSVSVNAPEGAFPEGTTMVVKAVSDAKAMNLAEAAADDPDKVADAKAVDITFYDKAGNEVQPLIPIDVKITKLGLEGENIEVVNVYHVEDNGAIEQVSSDATANRASFAADSFSIYVFAGIGNPHLMTYQFDVDGDGTVDEDYTQVVKTGDDLYAPEAPEKENHEFLGWFDGNTEFTGFGKQTAVDVTETITLTAKFQEVYYVFFMDNHEPRRVYQTEEGVPGDTIKTDVQFPVEAGQAITGWYDNEACEGEPVESVELENENVYLYAKIEEGYWLTFNSNGGTHIESAFYSKTAKTKAPAEPAKVGFDFLYWSETDDGEAFVFGETLTKDTILNAAWEGHKNINYTVIHWQENANDEEYSLYEGETLTGTAGELTEAVAKKYPGFKEGVIDRQMIIAGDGSTIVNVYYDREEYTILFLEKNKNYSGSTGLTCGKSVHTHTEDCYKEETIRKIIGYETEIRWGWFIIPYQYEVEVPIYEERTEIVPACSKEVHSHDETCYGNGSSGGAFNVLKTITAKYGADIREQWPKGEDEGDLPVRWCVNVNEKTREGTSPYQSGIATMPLGGMNFYKVPDTSGNNIYALYYYTETLKDGEYVEHHADKWKGSGSFSTTDEDFYVIDGFTYSRNVKKGTSLGYNGKTGEYSLTLKYDRNSYAIVYYNGGKVVDTINKKYEASLDNAELQITPERPEGIPENFIFKGWYDNPLGTGNPHVFSGNMPAYNITVYAIWEAPTFQAIAYDNMEGEGAAVDLGTVAYGGRVDDTKLPKVEVPAGYKWIGWATLEGGIYQPYDFNSGVYGNIELYPYYIDSQAFTISYDLNVSGIEGAVASIFTPVDSLLYAQNSCAEVKAIQTGTGGEEFTLGDQVFLGWSTDEDATEPEYQSKDKIRFGAANITLYAVWGDQAKTATLTYNANLPETENSPEQRYSYNNNAVQTVKAYNGDSGAFNGEFPPGYNFNGWNTAKDGSGTSYEPGNSILVDNKDDANNVLYAQWTPKPTIIITAASDSKVYDGDPLTNDEAAVTEGQLPEGYSVEAVMTDDSTITNAGSVDNVIKSYTILDVSGKDVTAEVQKQYNIKTANGTLTITPVEDEVTVTVTGNSDSVVYNGSEQSVTGFTHDGEGLGIEVALAEGSKAEAKGTDAGEYPMGLTAADFVATSANYSNITINVVDGKLTITPLGAPDGTALKVNILGNSSSVVYNGSEQRVEGYNVTIPGNSLYEEEYINFTGEAVAKGTDVGTYKMGLTADQFSNTNQNFNVEFIVVDGLLSITPVTGPDGAPIVVKIVGNTDTKVYNGQEQSVEGYTVTIPEGVQYDQSYIEFSGEAIAKGTEVDKYPMGLEAADFTNNNKNFSVTFEVTDGGLEIVPRNPDWTVTKTAELTNDVDGDDAADVGDTITYTIVVENTGNVDLTNLTVADKLNGEAYDLGEEGNIASLAVGDKAAITYEYVIQPDDTELSNVVTVTGPEDPEDPDDPEDPPVVVETEVENWSVVKTVYREGVALTDADKVNVGDVLTYEIVVTNTGTADLEGLIVKDVLNGDTEQTFQVGDLAAGKDWRTTYEYTVTSEDDSVSNVAVADEGEPDDPTVDPQDPDDPDDPDDPKEDETNNEVATYLLTINYVDTEGNPVALAYTDELKMGAVYDVESPTVEGYTPDYGRLMGAMPGEDLTLTVVYSLIAVPVVIDTPDGPVPTPVPVVPPVVPPAAVVVDGPGAADLVVVEDAETALANIEDGETPLAAMDHWALLNLILTIFTALMSIVLLVLYFKKKKDDEEAEAARMEDKEDTREVRRRGVPRILSAVWAVLMIIVFILTEDMTLPMEFTDEWTWLMVCMTIMQLCIAVFAKKVYDDERKEPDAAV